MKIRGRKVKINKRKRKIKIIKKRIKKERKRGIKLASILKNKLNQYSLNVKFLRFSLYYLKFSNDEYVWIIFTKSLIIINDAAWI